MEPSAWLVVTDGFRDAVAPKLAVAGTRLMFCESDVGFCHCVSRCARWHCPELPKRGPATLAEGVNLNAEPGSASRAPPTTAIREVDRGMSIPVAVAPVRGRRRWSWARSCLCLPVAGVSSAGVSRCSCAVTDLTCGCGCGRGDRWPGRRCGANDERVLATGVIPADGLLARSAGVCRLPLVQRRNGLGDSLGQRDEFFEQI